MEETKHDLIEEKARADRLLHAMLPQSIAAELKSGVDVSATEHPAVTILFSDIKGFTLICKDCQPMEVVGMLNQLYTLFDSLIEKHKVYKVRWLHFPSSCVHSPNLALFVCTVVQRGLAVICYSQMLLTAGCFQYGNAGKA